jgi:sensor histidine kinase YesM
VIEKVDADVLELAIQPLLLQPLVENAVRFAPESSRARDIRRLSH